ncbi:hypothetical protein TWF730_001655 [Orbilia blumenaviensis]|uniref:Uncharacterized protein n=1 Tax=Orbilia blumenaviensis TaxID=1796055 RepID=A0AAV9UM08_9PEZI
MRFFVGAIALLVGGAVAQDCNCDCKIDSCLQVVAGTSPFPAEPTVADCRSFMWEVITVAAETVTTTALVTATATNTVVDTRWTTITTTASFPLQKRQASGITVPTYATAACPQPSDFSSACKCVGISAGGTSYHHVLSTDTVTVTSTITVTEDVSTTTTATVAATATDLYFRIRAANVAENGGFQGHYLYTVDEAPNSWKRLALVNNANQAVTFRANPENKLTGADGTPIVGDITSIDSEQLYLQEPVDAMAPYECTFNPGDKTVGCQYTGNGMNYIYLVAQGSARLWIYQSQSKIASDNPGNGATGPLVLEAVPL